jgi:hypothetical protein
MISGRNNMAEGSRAVRPLLSITYEALSDWTQNWLSFLKFWLWLGYNFWGSTSSISPIQSSMTSEHDIMVRCPSVLNAPPLIKTSIEQRNSDLALPMTHSGVANVILIYLSHHDHRIWSGDSTDLIALRLNRDKICQTVEPADLTSLTLHMKV